MSSCGSGGKTHAHAHASGAFPNRPDRIWLLIAAIPMLLVIFDSAATLPVVRGALATFLDTLPFIAFAVIAVAWLKASGADALMARAFEGREGRMILFAAAMGALVPFCSCEVIPFVAALLAVGAPVAAVMAFLLSAPLMDPAMFFITAGTLGADFAVMKLAAAVVIGIGGGWMFRVLAKSRLLATPLRSNPAAATCGSSSDTGTGKGCGCSAAPAALAGQGSKPRLAFWHIPDSRRVFRDQLLENAIFLTKWLLFAFLLEQLVTRYVPASWISSLLGGEGAGPILLATLIGGPAYINGYAAIPLVNSLLEQGMSNGAAMSFVIAGGVSCVPTAVAIWGMVRPPVFALYVGVATVGAILAGFLWQAIA